MAFLSLALADFDRREFRVLNSVPLTEDDFLRAKTLDHKAVERDYPADFGGPMMPPKERMEENNLARGN